ncbi:MAG: carboxymuconolactone decarboxylase family protein [Acidobacteriota bacterium]
MDKLREIERKRKEAYTWFMRHRSKGYKAVCDMEAAIFPDGALSRKHKELIAVGISVVTQCESCMQWHVEKAIEHGATVEELVETLDVAIEMGSGAASVSARFAVEVIKDVLGQEA